MGTLAVWLLTLLQILTSLRGEGPPVVSYPDCGDRPPACATFDDAAEGDGWYLITDRDGTRLPVPAPSRGNTDINGVQWWTWGAPVTGD